MNPENEESRPAETAAALTKGAAPTHAQERNVGACRYCGRKIIWAKAVDGKALPLDPFPFVYLVVDESGSHMVVEREEKAFVGHMGVCAKRPAKVPIATATVRESGR